MMRRKGPGNARKTKHEEESLSDGRLALSRDMSNNLFVVGRYSAWKAIAPSWQSNAAEREQAK